MHGSKRLRDVTRVRGIATDMEPWTKKRPAGKTRTKLTPDEIERARERAGKAGRRYPNLVDNMWILRQRAP